jgi:hypothetical protein
MIGCMGIEYGLESHFERLRAKGMLTLDEMAQRLDISTQQLKTWRAVGLVRAHLCNDKNSTSMSLVLIHRSIDPSRKASGVRRSKDRRDHSCSRMSRNDQARCGVKRKLWLLESPRTV